MKRFYIRLLGSCLIVLAIQFSSFSQNLLVNGDFEKDGGSLNDWGVASGTSLGTDNTNHYAILHGENGVLYQKVTSVSPGQKFRCTMFFRNIKVRQTTGFGYAIEKTEPLVIPEFTIGASNLKNLCEPNGEWINMEASLEAQDTSMFYEVTLPDSATAIYVCIGSKGAVSDLQVDDIVFEEIKDPTGVTQIEGNEDGFKVYPVPARNEVTLDFSSFANHGSDDYLLGIHDQTGRRVRLETISVQNGITRLSVQSLNPGMYFITVPELRARAKIVVCD